MNGRFIHFSQEEEQKIRAEYLSKPKKVLAKELNVSYGVIDRFLKRNNLIIPKKIIEQRKAASRFKKNEEPFNKGVKQTNWMTKKGIENSKRTWFKKGNLPQNANPNGDGAITLRKDNTGRYYKYIRLKRGVWELYHRVLWEQEHGAIPDGYLIAFKDGNSTNVTLENLELVSMTENMYRNSRHNFPREIIPSMVLNKRLENTIKDLTNG